MEVRDPIFSFEIARRSVGRAAFQLGIDGMSENALDVMADILLNYLNRVGRTLSHLVEASGRTSAHVNILDALQACELVAAPAVERLHVLDSEKEEEELFAGTTTARTHLSSDWQGLAAFLFGPKWMEESEDEGKSKSSTVQQGNGAGGKVGPSATDDPIQDKPKKMGWDAPYLDEVLPFPQASQKCANPHPLPPYVGMSLHRVNEDVEHQKDEGDSGDDELNQIPDSMFRSSWGSISKRKIDSSEDTTMTSPEDVTMTDADAVEHPPPKKKVKISEAKVSNESDREKTEEEKQEELKAKLRIPSFYPVPPVMKTTASTQGRTIVDTQTTTSRVEKDDDGSRTVRSSLVQLGTYWGSGWDDPNNTKNAAAKSLAVPLGRSDPGEQPSSTSLVVPLGRASGSRVSRILEGSMDAAAMQ